MPMKRLALVLAVLSLAGSSVQAEAAKEPKLRVLFVGNSLTYVNDLRAVVAGLRAASKLPDVEYRMRSPGGWSIEDHWTIGDAPKVLASGRWDAVVLPAGDAAAAWRRDSKLQLYGTDGFHPSRLGTYLAALVIYAGLVNASPVGLPRVVPMPNGRYSVPAARARLLQRAAAEALRRR
jgi:hypothetical protein